MGALQDAMRRDMEIRGYAENTIESYLSHVRIFARHFRRSPLLVSRSEIETYFHYLRKQRKSESSIHLCYMSLRLFYKINGISDRLPPMTFRRIRSRVPRVLSKQTVAAMLSSCESLRFKTLFTLVYASGVRLSELRNLTVGDLDFDRRLVFIKQSKNRRNRYSLLGEQTIELLQAYLNVYKPHTYLFYNEDDTSSRISEWIIGREFTRMLKACDVSTAGVSLHTLRHCFATHLMESGVSIFHIMHLLGHTNIQTTMVYLHVQEQHMLNITSPIDLVDLNQSPRPSAQGQLFSAYA